MRRSSVIVFTLLLVVGAAACGSSGGSDAGGGSTATTKGDATASKSTTEPGKTTTTTSSSGEGAVYSKALTKGLTDETPKPSLLKLDQQQAECVAPKWVDIIGVDTFKAKGVPPADLEKAGFDSVKLGLDKDQASAMIEAVDGCDVPAVKNLRSFIENGLDAGQKACVSTELDDKTLQAVLEQSLYKSKPEGDLKDELDRIESTCKLGGTSGSNDATTNSVPTPSTVTPGG